jgi:HEAT repeat protein
VYVGERGRSAAWVLDTVATVSRSGSGRPPDRSARTAVVLTALFFLLGLAYVVGQAAAFSLFVERFGAQDVPYAFLLMPVLGAVLTVLTLRVGRRVDLGRLVVLEAVLMIVVALVVRTQLGSSPAPVIFLLPVWDAGVNALASVIVWSLAARCFDVVQVKRFGPLLSAGRSVALVAGGLLVPLVVRRADTQDLYVVQAAVLMAVVALLVVFVRRHHRELHGHEESQGRAGPRRGHATTATRSIAAAFAVVAASMLGYTLIRNMFLNRGAARFPDAADYAAQLGLLHAAQGIVTLVVALLAARRVLRRFGVRGALLSVSTIMLATAVPLLAAGPSLTLQYAIAAGGYVLCGALMHALRTPAVQLLYAPIEPEARTRALSLGDGLVEPVGVALGAVVLLVVTRTLALGVDGMAAAAATTAVVLSVACVIAFREYRAALDVALGRPRLRRSAFELVDDATARRLVDRARHGDIGQVAAVLSVLDDAEVDTASLLAQLTRHPAPEVQALALERLELRSPVPPLPHLAALTAPGTHPAVRAAAARLSVRTGATDTFRALVDDHDPEVRAAALAGARDSVSATTRADAERTLADWTAGSSASRATAARALRMSRRAGGTELLLELVADRDTTVRREALLAAGSRRDTALLRPLLAALREPTLRHAAADALVAFGPAAVEPVASCAAEPDRFTRRRVLSVLRRIEGPVATQAVLAFLPHDDLDVRSRAARALEARAVARPDETIESSVLVALLRDEARSVVATRSVVRELATSGPATAGPLPRARLLLLATLEDRLRLAEDHVLTLVQLANSSFANRPVARGLRSHDPRQRAYALEALDTAVPSAARAAVRAVAARSGTESVGLANATTAGHAADLTALAGPDAPGAQPTPNLRGLLDDPSPWICGLAAVVLGTAASPRPDPRNGASMSELIERVLTLKAVPAFSAVPTEALADLSYLLVEVELDRGDVLFRKGDPGTSLYIVASGGIGITDGAHELAVIGPHELFGELALLDEQPRSATATASAPSLLYELDESVFFELVGDRPEVLRAILASVASTLRRRSEEVAALRDEVAEPVRAHPGGRSGQPA